jgi:hypothetical protein
MQYKLCPSRDSSLALLEYTSRALTLQTARFETETHDIALYIAQGLLPSEEQPTLCLIKQTMGTEGN